jgi:hypothetical protein
MLTPPRSRTRLLRRDLGHHQLANLGGKVVVVRGVATGVEAEVK